MSAARERAAVVAVVVLLGAMWLVVAHLWQSSGPVVGVLCALIVSMPTAVLWATLRRA